MAVISVDWTGCFFRADPDDDLSIASERMDLLKTGIVRTSSDEVTDQAFDMAAICPVTVSNWAFLNFILHTINLLFVLEKKMFE